MEEQRASALIRLTSAPADYAGLGHGFRVEARIIIWQDPDALIVPSSALFRDAGDWAVFRVTGGAAALQRVTVGKNTGIEAQVLEGLEAGTQVVLFPSSGLTDGVGVAQRVIN